MEQYISKSALVAEIERLYDEKGAFYAADVLYNLEEWIDTLVVKEVDLESYNKIKRLLSLSFMHFLDKNRFKGKMCLSNMECVDIDKAFDEMDWVKLFRYLQNYLDEAQKGE